MGGWGPLHAVAGLSRYVAVITGRERRRIGPPAAAAAVTMASERAGRGPPAQYFEGRAEWSRMHTHQHPDDDDDDDDDRMTHR